MKRNQDEGRGSNGMDRRQPVSHPHSSRRECEWVGHTSLPTGHSFDLLRAPSRPVPPECVRLCSLLLLLLPLTLRSLVTCLVMSLLELLRFVFLGLAAVSSSFEELSELLLVFFFWGVAASSSHELSRADFLAGASLSPEPLIPSLAIFLTHSPPSSPAQLLLPLLLPLLFPSPGTSSLLASSLTFPELSFSDTTLASLEDKLSLHSRGGGALSLRANAMRMSAALPLVAAVVTSRSDSECGRSHDTPDALGACFEGSAESSGSPTKRSSTATRLGRVYLPCSSVASMAGRRQSHLTVSRWNISMRAWMWCGWRFTSPGRNVLPIISLALMVLRWPTEPSRKEPLGVFASANLRGSTDPRQTPFICRCSCDATWVCCSTAGSDWLRSWLPSPAGCAASALRLLCTFSCESSRVDVTPWSLLEDNWLSSPMKSDDPALETPPPGWSAMEREGEADPLSEDGSFFSFNKGPAVTALWPVASDAVACARCRRADDGTGGDISVCERARCDGYSGPPVALRFSSASDTVRQRLPLATPSDILRPFPNKPENKPPMPDLCEGLFSSPPALGTLLTMSLVPSMFTSFRKSWIAFSCRFLSFPASTSFWPGMSSRIMALAINSGMLGALVSRLSASMEEKAGMTPRRNSREITEFMPLMGNLAMLMRYVISKKRQRWGFLVAIKCKTSLKLKKASSSMMVSVLLLLTKFSAAHRMRS
mmetsp:Transcript_24578/g.61657  ORF Transcript_24578/g.61657 Transcript_24578/m.61657 type:complete len:710 (-) Transcript_24578:1456-3585(-)